MPNRLSGHLSWYSWSLRSMRALRPLSRSTSREISSMTWRLTCSTIGPRLLRLSCALWLASILPPRRPNSSKAGGVPSIRSPAPSMATSSSLCPRTPVSSSHTSWSSRSLPPRLFIASSSCRRASFTCAASRSSRPLLLTNSSFWCCACTSSSWALATSTSLKS